MTKKSQNSQQPLPTTLTPGGRVTVKIKPDSPESIPMYKSRGAAGADLKASIPQDEKGERVLKLMPGHTHKIDVGFSMQLPPGWEAQIRCRSSLAERGIQLANGLGTIDDDYRGPISVLLTNSGREIVLIKHGDRIGQMVLKPVWYFNWNIVQELDNTERGEGGFGSTGV